MTKKLNMSVKSKDAKGNFPCKIRSKCDLVLTINIWIYLLSEPVHGAVFRHYVLESKITIYKS